MDSEYLFISFYLFFNTPFPPKKGEGVGGKCIFSFEISKQFSWYFKDILKICLPHTFEDWKYRGKKEKRHQHEKY